MPKHHIPVRYQTETKHMYSKQIRNDNKKRKCTKQSEIRYKIMTVIRVMVYGLAVFPQLRRETNEVSECVRSLPPSNVLKCLESGGSHSLNSQQICMIQIFLQSADVSFNSLCQLCLPLRCWSI